LVLEVCRLKPRLSFGYLNLLISFSCAEHPIVILNDSWPCTHDLWEITNKWIHSYVVLYIIICLASYMFRPPIVTILF
jgi:hypothetical protein